MNHPKLYRWGALASAVIATIAIPLSGASGTVMRAGGHSTKAIKPDFGYYAGKKVTLITGGSPGGANDEAALIVAPLMASYLHCSISVEDLPADATVVAQDTIAHATPDGLTFGQGGPVGDIESQDIGQNDINFPLRTQEWIGSFSPPQYVIAVSASSPIQTLAQFLKAHGQIKFLSLTGGGSLNEQVLDAVFKLDAQFITGYPNQGNLLTGFLRGDGNASIINAPATAPYIAAGKFRGLALTQPYVKGEANYSVMSKLPVLSSYLAKHTPKSKAQQKAIKLLNLYNSAGNQVFFAPPGTPAKYVAALTAAFRSAVHQQAAQSALIAQGVPNGYQGPEQVAKHINEMIKYGPAIAPYLGTKS